MSPKRSPFFIKIFLLSLSTILFIYSESFGVIDKSEPFFRLTDPTKVDASLHFQLAFSGLGGNDVFFIIENEAGDEIHSSEEHTISDLPTGWFGFILEESSFEDDDGNESPGRYLVTCIDKDIGFDDILWSAWIIRDQDGLDEDDAKYLLNKYSPYVSYGDHTKSSQSINNPWGYEFEREQYYPIDIRDLSNQYPDGLSALNIDGADDFKLTVGKKAIVPYGFGFDWSEYYLSNPATISSIKNISYYNDIYQEYGVTRVYSFWPAKYELLEFHSPNDSPYVSEIKLDNFDQLKNDSKIYGTAYEHNGYIFLQYFFYYPFDPKNGKGFANKDEAISRHSADTERIVVVLKKESTIEDVVPQGVLYFHHLNSQGYMYYDDNDPGSSYPIALWNFDEQGNNPGDKDFGGCYVEWGKTKKKDSHPYVYVALGSHGCYPREGSYAVDTPQWPGSHDLLEYAGGQTFQTYSINSSLVYLPRLSEVDTDNEEFSFLLFSGIAAQTENYEWIDDFLPGDPIITKLLSFPPQSDTWYAVERYCFDGDTFSPRNDISDSLDDPQPVTGSIRTMNFEDGVDGNVVRSTIPGMSFTTTEGFDWIYSDVSTGNYNYPLYWVNGNIGVWLGDRQGAGKITFTGATTTSFSIAYSAYNNFYLKAYDKYDNLIDYDSGLPNVGTGKTDRLTVKGNTIAYVLVHDQGNYWIVDDIAVSDLLANAQSHLQTSYTNLLGELFLYDINQTTPISLNNDTQRDLRTILSWGGSEFNIKIFRPDGTLFTEDQSETPPIIIDIPNAMVGEWIIQITAVDIPYNDYPAALVVGAGDSVEKPKVVTGIPTAITGNAATLNGKVNPKGASTKYYFQYGTTMSYGSTTPIGSAGSSATNKLVSNDITELQPNTIYHCRLIATNSEGTTYGGNITFMTTSTYTQILTKQSDSLTIQYDEYVKVIGSTGNHTINVASGGQVECINFIGENQINIQGSTAQYMVKRSGAMVSIADENGTLIKIPATNAIQTLRFADGSSSLIIRNGKVMIGGQEILTTETPLASPENPSDTSEGIF